MNALARELRMRVHGAVPVLILMLAACDHIPGTAAYAVGRAERATAARMIDPASAEFQSVSIEGPSALEVACGEVRGKDRTGRYGSFDRFLTLADGEAPMIDEDVSGRVTSSAAVPDTVFDTAWNQECFASPIPTYRPDAITNMLDPAIGPTVQDAEEAANSIDDENALDNE